MILLSRTSLNMAAALVIAALGMPAVLAQETTTTTTTPQSVSGLVTIETSQVIYVSGDDAVLKLPDGSLRLLELHPGTSLTVDGKPVKPSDLTPGATLSHVRVSRRVESEVTTVTQINGIVTRKQGRVMTLRLDDGTTKIYSVPYNATFSINGKTVGYGEIATGSKIAATIVKTEGLSTVSANAGFVGQTPPQSGTLLVEK